MDWMLHKVHMVYVRQKLFWHIDVPLHAFHAVHCTVYSVHDRLGKYAEIQIIFGTVCTVQLSRITTKSI